MITAQRRLLGLTAAGLTAALVLSACGSSDNGSASSTAGANGTTSTAAGNTADTGSTAAGPGTAGSDTAAPSGDTAASGGAGSSSAAPLPAAQLTLLFGSSGKAETDALNAATAAWAKTSGSTVTVTPAQNLTQQLAQGFSSGTAPDVFYVGADQMANYAKAGNLLAYADSLPNAADFYPVLKQSFSYDGKFYCAPKDFSTLALFINTDLWTKAGLTDADIPKNWNDLEKVAKKLGTGGVAGLSVSPERDRVDAFLAQNGAYLVNDSGKPTADDSKNVEALTFVKKLMTEGALKTPKELGASWAGEAFGKGTAAMVVEGNWLLGALKSDYPNLKYKVAELPAGPTGTKGTLEFTNCWGISATTKNPDQAKALVSYLTGTDVQLGFAKAFGVIPSVQSAKDQYLAQNPDNKPFVDGIDYAKGVVAAPGVTEALDDYNSQLQNLAGSDPKTILESVQQNLSDAMGGN